MRPRKAETPETLALLARVQASEGSDSDAIEALVREQMDRVHGVCASLIRDPEVANELAQEAVLRMVRSLPRFRGECAWSTWTFRIARNLCLNWLEKRREELGDEGLKLVDPRGTALDHAAEDERARGVRAAVADVLSEEERQAVLLHYEAGLSVQEVTETMQLANASGARGVLQRARRKLKKQLSQSLWEDSIVQRSAAPRGAAPAKARDAMERTLVEATRSIARDTGEEPRLRTMSPRSKLLD